MRGEGSNFGHESITTTNTSDSPKLLVLARVSSFEWHNRMVFTSLRDAKITREAPSQKRKIQRKTVPVTSLKQCPTNREKSI